MPTTKTNVCPICSAPRKGILQKKEKYSLKNLKKDKSEKSKGIKSILNVNTICSASINFRKSSLSLDTESASGQDLAVTKKHFLSDIKKTKNVAPKEKTTSVLLDPLHREKGALSIESRTLSTDPLLSISKSNSNLRVNFALDCEQPSEKRLATQGSLPAKAFCKDQSPPNVKDEGKVTPGNVTSRLYRSQSLPADSTRWNALHASDPLLLEALARETAHRGTRESWATMLQHYYPEGGWGWIIVMVAVTVALLCHGLHTGFGMLLCITAEKFNQSSASVGWLGAMTTSIALFLSPLTIAVCRRKSTRLTAVLGGLVTALGCLFTSFASRYHQLFFSYGTVIGVGVGMTRDSSSLMVGQYFKRRREFVEIFVVSGSGLGISVMSAFVQSTVGSVGWRLGLQAVTATVFLTFLLGTFYRSASLYHPQRRAILHLKNQKRKIKEKNRQEEKPPLFDITTLKSRTIQILLFSISLSSFGITTPIIYLAHQAEEEGLGETGVLLLQTYLGLGWVTGCCVFGFLVVQRSSECRVGRQYLCQAAMFLCGVSTLAFTAVEGYHGYVLFAWLYGIFSGGFHYTLKMFTYEKVRARNFARTWGYVQCSQAIPTAIGIPITGYINVGYGNKAGYYFSSTLIIFGSMTIFLIDIHRRNAARHKHNQKNDDEKGKCLKETCTESKHRRDSLAQLDRDVQSQKYGLLHQRSLGLAEGVDARNKELTCISEEGIADMDIPDHILEELEYLGDCITSCDKVENYLMMSEYENNLVKTGDLPLLDKRNRKRLFSLRQGSSFTPELSANGSGLKDATRRDSLVEAQNSGNILPPASAGTVPITVQPLNNQNIQITPTFGNQKSNIKSGNFRTISVIEEASV